MDVIDGPALALPDGVRAADAPRVLIEAANTEGSSWGAFVQARVTGGWCGAGSLDAQAYTLEVLPGAGGLARARIESPSIQGVRHALATLAGVVSSAEAAPDARRVVSRARITDRPAFAARGVMLDVSRCRIPTMREFVRILDTLALLKINHAQLYTEHTFAYPGHEEAWRGWSPITPDELRRLDDLARERGIELAANQNCFGHLRHWLELPRYAHLAETHGEWMFDAWPRSGPFSLCPTDPASLAFVASLLDEQLPCVRSGLVNIGCDETYDVGAGRSAGEVSRRGRASVCVEFLARVIDAARARGKRSMFWADVALSDERAAGAIPGDAIALAWGYEPDSPFDRWCEVLAARRASAHHPGGGDGEFWVCPGTSSWRSIAGRTRERHGNLASAAHAGRRSGASGVLVCDWGDSGHHQVWPVAAMGIAHGAAMAWNPDAPFDAAAAARVVLGAGCEHAGPWLEAMGDVDAALREACLGLSRPGMSGRLRNQSAMFIDMITPWDRHRDVGEVGLWRDAAEGLEELASRRPRVAHSLVNAELEHVAATARFALARAVARREAGGSARAGSLREALAELRRRHGELWLVRSRVGGLARSANAWDACESGMPA